MGTYRETFEYWKNDPFFDEATRAELASLTDEREIEDRFYRDLEFGTGGLRGVMGAGTNRMNQYNVRRATTGFAQFLLDTYGDAAKTRGVAIAFDSRNRSQEFAHEAALTMAAAGIPAYLFTILSATPLLSFAVRHLGCAGGIVITASHNPKEYNGYKAYDETGCQLGLEDAAAVIDRVGAVDITATRVMDEDAARAAGLYHEIGREVLDAFEAAVETQAHELPAEARAALKIVYSPLHGTGNVPVREVLAHQGFTGVRIVAAQEKPDGNFSTVRSPNPEERDALCLAIEQAEAEGADLVLGTDPDCDRVGIAVRGKDGFQLFSGNQTGALLVNYVLTRRAAALNPKSTLVKTIVTSEFGADIAKKHGLQVVDTLTGFKFIGDRMNRYEKDGSQEFVMGYEESYGYLVGTHARDKDAVVASMLICEMAAYYLAQGKTLVDVLAGLYEEYGMYLDVLDSYTLKGKDGAERIRAISAQLRQRGVSLMPDVTELLDYTQGVGDLPKSDVLKYRFADGSWMAVRPSGTEPKIKVYYSVRRPTREEAEQVLAERRAVMNALIDA
ncbi:MAG: phospho-sugar mutase [Clostridiaceae bacterium]|nr:phospho-sugar mutase [Clostridiaceae bacterium]